MKPLAAFLLGAIAGGLSVYLAIEAGSEPVARQLAESQKANSLQAAQIERQRHEIAAQNDALHKLHAASSETSKLAAPPPAHAKPASPLAGIAALMDNPAMKKMMAASQRKVIDDNYADLADALHLNAEERARFLDLLGAKQALEMEFGMQALKATPEERKTMYEARKTREGQAEADIREFLNSDADFALYKDYTDQLPQRMQLQAMQPAFERIGQPLDSAQKKALLGIMSAAGKEKSPSPDPVDPSLSEDGNARMIARETARQKRIAEAAATVLSPQQLAVFREKQASNLQMMKIGIEMGRAMLGDDSGAAKSAP